MVSSSNSFYVIDCYILVVAVTQTIAQPNFLYHFCQGTNYTDNSAYQTNLNRLLSILPSNTSIDYGFYNSSYGQNSDQVQAIGLCRGDVKPEACRSCLSNSTHLLTEVCPNRKEAIGWYDQCMLPYSNRFISGVEEHAPSFYMWNLGNVSSNYVADFKEVLTNLMAELKNEAAAGGSLRKYATGNAKSNFQTIYALVQCTPDLSLQDCTNCLNWAIEYIPTCCDGKKGGRVYSPSCYIRFEEYIFYEPSNISTGGTGKPPLPSPTPPPASANIPPSPTQGKKSNTSETIIFIVVPIVVSVVLVISVCAYLRQRKGKARHTNLFGRSSHTELETADEIATADSLQYGFNIIRVATDNFSAANKLGQGGFGPVYRVRI
ncbi:hypothetical protein FEM48_Zijuj01G0135100 [Ziziphus jujuba var. spinosa]|uniref:Gnk2-homologous domain-containing protein n=1 Tax=Ziziphus jujuba var. spinosa TaxID=714518 RepID=A0A978W1J3_ZIZJJ|nr:hypothetical protein FEM48_Zijuj01G0135100 [Ziziphus jujuba var. spinosa]